MRKLFLTQAAFLSGVLLFPTMTLAQGSPCADMDPVSPYTAEVLKVSQETIDRVSGETGNSTFFDLFGYESLATFWGNEIASAFLQRLDTELRVVAEQRQLLETTACLHIDLCLIEEEIEKVHQEALAAHARGSVIAISDLLDLTKYLNKRYEKLLQGARDPHFLDAVVGLCPFDSDYLPPTQQGYGCDRTALSPYQSAGHTATEAEYEALNTLVETRERFQDDTSFIQQIADAFAVINGTIPSSIGTYTRPSHKRFQGCIQPGSAGGADIEALTQTSFRELRGPFSLEKDDIRILIALLELHVNWSKLRSWPEYLLYRSERFPDEDPPENDPYMPILQDIREVYFPVWFRKQSTKQALMVAKSQDASLQTQAAIAIVRAPMKALALQAFGKDFVASATEELKGVRGFVRDLAYYVRRSCVFRLCSERLDRIEKTIFADDCFPYARGAYLADDEIHEKCLSKAED